MGAFSHSAKYCQLLRCLSREHPCKPPTHRVMHDQFKTASGVQNSGPWDPWLSGVENSRLFAQRAHSARCAPDEASSPSLDNNTTIDVGDSPQACNRNMPRRCMTWSPLSRHLRWMSDEPHESVTRALPTRGSCPEHFWAPIFWCSCSGFRQHRHPCGAPPHALAPQDTPSQRWHTRLSRFVSVWPVCLCLCSVSVCCPPGVKQQGL